MPVYEMYKVGDDPYWLDGINLLESATGIRAAVIAHYNNAQGGTHDTRFCFAGERRMKILETLLPGDTAIFGIDEHTGIAFDLEAKSAEIPKNSQVTLRQSPKFNAAVLPFSGITTWKKAKSKEEELRAVLQKEDIKAIGPLQIARFDPPWKPGFARYNEVILPIA